VADLQRFVPRAAGVVDKYAYTLFTDDGEKLVRSGEWTDLYICGIDTEVCVLKTAVDAFERDVTPWIIADASASHSGRQAHDAGVLVATKMIGRNQVVGTAEALRGAVPGDSVIWLRSCGRRCTGRPSSSYSGSADL
jgi:nicotinamidase-related amidase